MSDQKIVRPAIYPFIIGDLLLLAAACGIVYQSPWPLGVGHMALCVAAVAIGAWLMVIPFILQYRAELKLDEAETLSAAVVQIQNLEEIKTAITQATGQWQSVQKQCAQTVETANAMAADMAKEAKSFAEFMHKANDAEKATMRLEIEKQRRMEGDWLQVLVRLMDHVYALYVAGLQSGQPNVIQQLSSFQNACRDSARRVGLVPYIPQPGEPFNPNAHQVTDETVTPSADAWVERVIATGYTYQGQLLRPALVIVNGDATTVREAASAATAATSAAEMADTTVLPSVEGSDADNLDGTPTSH